MQHLKYDENIESCTFPDVIRDLVESFRKFYTKKHTGRKLTFQGNGGNADLKATFKTRAHELNVPTYAMVVLLAFNDLSPENPFLTFSVCEIHSLFKGCG